MFKRYEYSNFRELAVTRIKLLLQVAELAELLHQVDLSAGPGRRVDRLGQAELGDLDLLFHVRECQLGDGVLPRRPFVKGLIPGRQLVG